LWTTIWDPRRAAPTSRRARAAPRRPRGPDHAPHRALLPKLPAHPCRNTASTPSRSKSTPSAPSSTTTAALVGDALFDTSASPISPFFSPQGGPRDACRRGAARRGAARRGLGAVPLARVVRGGDLRSTRGRCIATLALSPELAPGSGSGFWTVNRHMAAGLRKWVNPQISGFHSVSGTKRSLSFFAPTPSSAERRATPENPAGFSQQCVWSHRRTACDALSYISD
jgi:hypothetical protein